MCGIFGYISNKKYEPELIGKRLSESLRHRGPDANGLYFDDAKNVLIGHRRLSIIDLSDNADQPYIYKNIVMTFNGEIYNYKELRQELEQEGVSFRTESDTEVLIKIYSQWGVNGFQKLNGMFAVGIYDKDKNKLILLRDRIGKKPLLYFNFNSSFGFASEAKAFKYFPALEGYLDLSLSKVRDSIHLMWLDENEKTILNNVVRVPPASYVVYDLSSQSINVYNYWALTKKYSGVPYSEAVDEYRDLLLDSVKLRTRSDCGVSVMLSGGLDSSLISSMVADVGVEFDTYTLKFDSKYSEHKEAQAVAKYLGVNNYPIEIKNQLAFESLKENISLYDDLSTFDPGLITTFLASMEIKKNGEKVVLLGEGSDEINAGYGKFKASLYPYSWFPKILRESIVYYASSRNNLSRSSFFSGVKGLSKKLSQIEGTHLQKLTGYDILYQLPNHLLMKVDRGTMGASLEGRTPFLDYRLVDFVFNLPDRYKLSYAGFGVRNKKILRDVAATYLPPDTLSRKKFGMMLPIKEFINENNDAIVETAFSYKDLLREILPGVYIDQLVRQIKLRNRSTGFDWLIWRLLIILLWNQSNEVI
jgi:asparagine synthase (glutamine-hydrolysing)